MNKTTNRSRRPTRDTSKLKRWLFTSSLIATLGGTHLLNMQNAKQQVIAAGVDNEPIAVIEAETGVYEYQPGEEAVLQPSPSRQRIEIAPQRSPQILPFGPVAQSHSSR